MKILIILIIFTLSGCGRNISKEIREDMREIKNDSYTQCIRKFLGCSREYTITRSEETHKKCIELFEECELKKYE